MILSPERWRSIIHGEATGLAAFLWRRLLWLARGPYALGSWWHHRKYSKPQNVTRVDVPVISVGNLTVGGTGKTPCVEYIAKVLRDQGVMVAILSRGYGAVIARNDEAMVLEENLPDVPHLQGANRIELAQTAISELESECFILDDGFQHRQLGRDLDIVLIDASDPWIGNYLLPRGGLREPKSRLSRADVIMLTRVDQARDLPALVAEVQRLAPGKLVVHSIHQPQNPGLSGQRVAAFCGIGHPEAFRRTLVTLGATVLELKIFPDHHPYSRNDVDSLQRWANTFPADTVIVTTQKDWVKLRIDNLAGRRLEAVRIELEIIEGEAAFTAALLEAARISPTDPSTTEAADVR